MFSSYVKIPEGKATKSRLQRKPGWLLDLLSSLNLQCQMLRNSRKAPKKRPHQKKTSKRLGG